MTQEFVELYNSNPCNLSKFQNFHKNSNILKAGEGILVSVVTEFP